MCLAKAYVRAADGDTGGQLLMENVTRVVVEGDRVRLTSILSETQELPGRIMSVDFAEARLVIESVEGGAK